MSCTIRDFLVFYCEDEMIVPTEGRDFCAVVEETVCDKGIDWIYKLTAVTYKWHHYVLDNVFKQKLRNCAQQFITIRLIVELKSIFFFQEEATNTEWLELYSRTEE